MKRLMWGLSGLVGLGCGAMVYLILGGPYPSLGGWLHRYLEPSSTPDRDSTARPRMEQVIGGGHYYGLDGRDLWLRFRYVEDQGDRAADSSPDSHSDTSADTSADSSLDTSADSSLDKLSLNWSRSPQCTPSEQAIVTQWFTEAVARPTLWAWLTPWSELSNLDQQSLSDRANLDCVFSTQIPVQSTQYPRDCGYWWLHHRQTRLVYVRYACYN